ncbi:UNVERIFIED_CONTAM: hypothetical protein FKN15_042245, partial [Acipenser sinensis]
SSPLLSSSQNRDFHGFHKDPQVDVWNMKVAFFFGISVAIVIGGTFVHYLPDHGYVNLSKDCSYI